MSGEKRPLYADAQAFLGFPGEPPRIEDGMMLDLALVTCAPPVGPFAASVEKTLEAIDVFKAQLGATDAVRFVERQWQVDVEDGRLNVVLGLQNLPSDMNPGIGDGFPALRWAGVRVIALAYDTVNPFGSGCLNLDMGLTDMGRNAICRMAEYGFILDLSHAGHRMAREVLEFVDKANLDIPVMASHGGCYSIYPHFRNLPDDVLIAIAKRGGVVGISNLTFILDMRDNGLEPVWNHLEHALSMCGEKHVVLGTDAPYIAYTSEEEQALFSKMKDLIDPHGTWGARNPSYTSLINRSPLHRLGAFEDYYDGVLGLNLLNFFRRALPEK